MATILIVDDRAINRKFLVTLLGYANHRLLEAGDGAEALEIVRAARPDLVITDLLMPTMDGFELVQRIRDDPDIAQTQVIFYTATYRLQEAKQLADAARVSTVIPKPSDPETFKLAHILQSLIGNAIKFTDEGSVTVSARVVQRDAQRAKRRESGGRKVSSFESRVERNAEGGGEGKPETINSGSKFLRIVRDLAGR